MTNRSCRLAGLATAAFLAFASQLALAHGGYHHGEAAAPAVAGQASEAIAAVPTAQQHPAAAASSSCPDGSGGECCCRQQPSTTSPGKAAPVNFGGWTRPVPRISSPPAGRPVELLPQPSAVSPALPRAPPQFS